jgi:hypothetical protein
MPEQPSATQVQALLGRMIAHMQANTALQAKCAYDNASLGIILNDLGIEANMRFVKGQVSGGPGGAQDCAVSITLSWTTLERILTGKLDPESGYMGGAFYLRGSEYTAEGLLRYVPDLVAAYRAATAN